MKSTNRIKLVSVFLVAAYLLSACSGTAPQPGSPVGGGKPLANEVAFTGTVESVNAGEITVSGQVVAIDAGTVMDSNIQVGDIVKVEAKVSDAGAVVALKIESSSGDDSTNANDGNTNDDNSNATANDNSSTGIDNTNSGDNTNTADNGNSTGGTEQEITGVVDAITAESVTVDGVTYQFASFTEFKDVVSVGDQVKLHVIVGMDGSLTIREIERTDGTGLGGDNSNDDNSNDDNGNDDNSNDDDDSNDDNSNDDDSNDDNSNSGSNSNGG